MGHAFILVVTAVGKGLDVYLFLTGMMLLAELARQQGVFDWLAALAVTWTKGSRSRLFLLIYTVGILVTVLLSNDATVVVLTPAVYAAVNKARAEPLPYLFACAFVANAASFVLPISNPANLVVYGRDLPPLLPWFRIFLFPSVVSTACTYLVLRFLSRQSLQGLVESVAAIPRLSAKGRRAAWGIVFTGIILIGASAAGRDLGWPTCLAGIAVVVISSFGDAPRIVRGVSWSVIPLVAGLFVLIEVLDQAGAATLVANGLRQLTTWPIAAALCSSFSVAVVSNIMNNLPCGLLTAGALQRAPSLPEYVRHALLIGVDLGPNLSVTGSLATILWLIALRRDGVNVSPWRFLKTGILVMPPALLLATLAVAFTAR